MRRFTFVDYDIHQMLDRKELVGARVLIHSLMTSSPAGTVLCLDMSGVQWVNSSGSDELIGFALEALQNQENELFLFIETQDNRYEHCFNIHNSLTEKHLPVMVRITSTNGPFEVKRIGYLQGYLDRILYFIYSGQYESVTSSIIAEVLHIEKTFSSTALSQLYKNKLIKRERLSTQKGFEYLYYPLFM